MKLFPSLLAASSAVLLSTAAHATTLASWDTWTDSTGSVLDADFTFTGFDATIAYDGSRVNTSFGSNDTTFGTLSGPAATAGGALLVRDNASDTLTLTLTNTSGSSYSIDTLNLDFGARLSGVDGLSFDAFDIVYTSGGLGNGGTLIGSAADVAVASASVSNLSDFDFDLSDNLVDTVLGSGESALFTFTFSGQDAEAQFVSAIFDNVAVTGAAVPEPSSFALLSGCLALGAVMIRRRR